MDFKYKMKCVVSWMDGGDGVETHTRVTWFYQRGKKGVFKFMLICINLP